jgi:hypothetical protein
MAQVNGDPKYKSYTKRRGLDKTVDDPLKASNLIYEMAEALRSFNSFKNIFRITKLSFMTDRVPIDSFSA